MPYHEYCEANGCRIGVRLPEQGRPSARSKPYCTVQVLLADIDPELRGGGLRHPHMLPGTSPRVTAEWPRQRY